MNEERDDYNHAIDLSMHAHCNPSSGPEQHWLCNSVPHAPSTNHTLFHNGVPEFASSVSVAAPLDAVLPFANMEPTADPQYRPVTPRQPGTKSHSFSTTTFEVASTVATGPTPSTSATTVAPNENDQKRKDFLERNRQAALKCRQRKKKWLQDLQKRVEEMTDENRQLERETVTIREEILNLKTLLLAHKDCPVAQASRVPSNLYPPHHFSATTVMTGPASTAMPTVPQSLPVNQSMSRTSSSSSHPHSFVNHAATAQTHPAFSPSDIP